ncbi:MAG: YfiM family protein [Bacteroidales bacterium]|nr:YfiM family protein [Bacteroidales bacterium]
MPNGLKNITGVLLFILWPALSWSIPPDSIQNTDTNHTAYSPNYRARLIGVSVTAGALYAGSMAGLYHLWYAGYPQSSFHFFNDCNEWMLMDKAGHVTSSYWVGRIGYESLRWSGVENKKAIWYGGTWGLIYLTTVEIFDGFSAEWGFSGCDMAANVLGTGLFIGQQLLWDRQPLTIKFSTHSTEYAGYRPDLLGENFIQQLLKDYNGQTYWLSLNLASLMPKNSRFPKWLNFSFGYGADGMLGATSNPTEYLGEPLPYFERYSQYYLSLDIDPTKIKTNNETVRFLLNMIGFIKLPFPALEFNRVDKLRWHWMYF